VGAVAEQAVAARRACSLVGEVLIAAARAVTLRLLAGARGGVRTGGPRGVETGLSGLVAEVVALRPARARVARVHRTATAAVARVGAVAEQAVAARRACSLIGEVLIAAARAVTLRLLAVARGGVRTGGPRGVETGLSGLVAEVVALRPARARVARVHRPDHGAVAR